MQIYGPYRVSTPPTTSASRPQPPKAGEVTSRQSAAPVDQLDLSAAPGANRIDMSNRVASSGEIRIERVAELRRQIAERVRTRTREEWADVFRADGPLRDACATPVLTPSEAAGHAHSAVRGTFCGNGDVLAHLQLLFGREQHRAPTTATRERKCGVGRNGKATTAGQGNRATQCSSAALHPRCAAARSAIYK